MATEELTLVVNDADLQVALMRINMLKTAQKRTTTQTRGLSALITKTRKDARAAGINLDDLPTLNRDMRLAAGMLPGFREFSVLLFQARRGVRAQQLMREAEALKKAGLKPELARRLEMGAYVGQLAMVAFAISALVALSKKVDRIERDIIRARGGYEDMIREGLDLTHEEYLAIEAEQVGYATALDEFKAKWDAGEYLDAIADYVIAQIPSRLPTYAGRLPYDPTTIPPELEEHWLYQLDQMLTDWWKNLWRDRGKSNEDTDYEYNMNVMGGDVH